MYKQGEALAYTVQRWRPDQLGLRAVVGIRAALTNRRYRQELAGHEALSPWHKRLQRVGGVATGAAGLFLSAQALKATGSADNNLEQLGLIELATSHVDGLDLTDIADIETVETVEATTEDYNFCLPTDINQAPESLPLGPYNPNTGHGTVWAQTMAYADKLGFGDLSEQQKWDLTERILDHNGLTWDDAEGLSANYEPQMPTQTTMENWLEQEGATRTHPAERPVEPEPTPPPPSTTPGTDGDEFYVLPDDAQPPADCGYNRWYPSWHPFSDCQWNIRDNLFVASLAAALSTGYIYNEFQKTARQQDEVEKPAEAVDEPTPTSGAAATAAAPATPTPGEAPPAVGRATVNTAEAGEQTDEEKKRQEKSIDWFAVAALAFTLGRLGWRGWRHLRKNRRRWM